jgi:hypothetical protein
MVEEQRKRSSKECFTDIESLPYSYDIYMESESGLDLMNIERIGRKHRHQYILMCVENLMPAFCVVNEVRYVLRTNVRSLPVDTVQAANNYIVTQRHDASRFGVLIIGFLSHISQGTVWRMPSRRIHGRLISFSLNDFWEPFMTPDFWKISELTGLNCSMELNE